MYYAIKTLEARIVELNTERERCEKIMDEPELQVDLEWAKNDIFNIDLQLLQVQEAIKLLIIAINLEG